MKVAIIGTGNVGSALGGSLARAGHEVTFTAQDAAKTRDVAERAGGTASINLASAVADADVVILAVPFGAVEGVAREIAGSAAGKVVVDVTNPIKADYSGLSTGPDASGAELLVSPLAGAKVVKAFNTLFASVQGDPAAHGTRLDALIATDDDSARETVSLLASSVGFRPVYVGPLAAARELEAMAWLNIRLNMLANGSWQSSYVLVAAPDATKEA